MKKTSYKKGFVSFLILALLMLYIPVASYASTDRYQFLGDYETGEPIDIADEENVVTALFKVEQTVGDSRSFLAYCLDFNTMINVGIDYQVAFLDDVSFLSNPGEIRNVVTKSYPNKSLGYLNSFSSRTWESITKEEAIAATQAAIWHLTHGIDYINNGTENTYAFYTYLIGLPSYDKPTIATIDVVGPTVSIVGSDVSIEFYYKTDGVNYDESPIALSLNSSEASGFNVNSSSGDGPYVDYTKVTLTKATADFDSLSDFTFTLSIEGTQSIKDVYAFIPVGGKDESQTLVSECFVTTTQLYEDIKIDLTEYLSSLTINKSYISNDSIYTGSEATEATFELKSGETIVKSGTTNNLTLTFDGLLPGVYTLVETSSGNYTSSLEFEDEDVILIPFNEAVSKDVVNFLETTEDPEDPEEPDDPESYSLTVNHLLSTGGNYASPVVITGWVEEEYYTTSAALYDINVYSVSTPENASGTFGSDDITVTYIYTPIVPEQPTEPQTEPPTNPPTNPPNDPPNDPPAGPRGTVRVHHEDTEGVELASVFEFSSNVGSTYNTGARSFEGYELVSTPSNASGIIIDGTIDVIYVYSNEVETEIETEPVPLAPPIVPEETEEPEEPEEEIVLDEEVPLADPLPQTGQIPTEILFGIGSVLSLLGISLKKKK